MIYYLDSLFVSVFLKLVLVSKLISAENGKTEFCGNALKLDLSELANQMGALVVRWNLCLEAEYLSLALQDRSVFKDALFFTWFFHSPSMQVLGTQIFISPMYFSTLSQKKILLLLTNFPLGRSRPLLLPISSAHAIH